MFRTLFLRSKSWQCVNIDDDVNVDINHKLKAWIERRINSREISYIPITDQIETIPRDIRELDYEIDNWGSIKKNNMQYN